ncbi:phospholipase effector Tle1 domain-containing protein [Pseudoalteromonas luteoviolacea]|uniref:phospholipase effector Tle1 domain-containing protein n=1 Tax=Pseudoalteromonas luteoviolacea TaxID=43657 RepID=UPI0011478665|nr:DUF2235 domain-containing protein [Pseudoalteromonas luteoviolacea]
MKRLVLCMDGTWNKPAQYDRGKRKPTNVVKLARGIELCAMMVFTKLCITARG